MRGLDQNVCNSTLSGDNDDVILGFISIKNGFKNVILHAFT